MYFMSFENAGTGDNNDPDMHPPILGIYTSIEKMYTDYCEHQKDENYSTLHFGEYRSRYLHYHFESYTRLQFANLIATGGKYFDVDHQTWVKFSNFELNKLKSIGEWEPSKSGIKVNYTPLVHEYLETKDEEKTCQYKDLDLDCNEFICGIETVEHGYCKLHLNVYFGLKDYICNRIEEIFHEISEEQEEEFNAFHNKFEEDGIISSQLIIELKDWEFKTGITDPIKPELDSLQMITSENINLIPKKELSRFMDGLDKEYNSWDHKFYLYLDNDRNMLFIYDGPISENKQYHIIKFEK